MAPPAAHTPGDGGGRPGEGPIIRELLGEELIRLFLAVKRHEIAKATEHARDYTADDWADRVDDFEVAEFFEFL